MTDKVSPVMSQWHECKNSAPDALLLFRMGDFYESFYEDAKQLANCLQITLTSRQGIPMSGIPAHSIEQNIEKLVICCERVAIAEQTEAKNHKGLLHRQITSIVTPGTLLNFKKTHNFDSCFIATIYHTKTDTYVALLDISLDTIYTWQHSNLQSAINDICNVGSKELVISESMYSNHTNLLDELKSSHNIIIKKLSNFWFQDTNCTHILKKQFNVFSLDCFGICDNKHCIICCGVLIRYLSEDLHVSTKHITKITREYCKDYLLIDRTTQMHLNLLPSSKNQLSLFHTLNKAKTHMGKRALFEWIARPLMCTRTIQHRQELIKELIYSKSSLFSLNTYLPQIADIQRICTKIITNTVTPKELKALKDSISCIESIKSCLQNSQLNNISVEISNLHSLKELFVLLDESLLEDPSNTIGDGSIFKPTWNNELQEAVYFANESRQWLNEYQELLRNELNIRTLKVGFTPAFGYYIEVSKGMAKFVPDDFVRIQTLTNSERFRSDYLNKASEKISVAKERVLFLEAQLFQNVKSESRKFHDQLMCNGSIIAKIDVVCALAECAITYDYCCPQVSDTNILHIEKGRHPVLERVLPPQSFIPNDTYLHDNKSSAIITGPNMGGKSTYLKQVAILSIMAQMGSFVPAHSMTFGIIDRVFSRIGSNDDMMNGRSTFMVEMSEMSNIVLNTTSQSLVIIDEIGRGTSTYDGIAIAQSILEFLLTENNKQPKLLFATHFFELTKICQEIPSAFNLHVSATEHNECVQFLHKLELGPATKSFGIHVAKLSGMPEKILKRASEIQHSLENLKSQSTVHTQPHLEFDDPIQTLQKIDLATITKSDATKLLKLIKYKNGATKTC